MGYAKERGTNSASTAVAAVLVVVLLLVLGIMVLGAGAWFFARARASEEQAMAVRQRAVVQERALVVAGEFKAKRDAQTADSRRKVTIQLDHEGNIQTDGDPLQLADLKAKLEDTSKETDMAVVISVDNRCLFQHVGAVLDVCRQIGIQVDVGSLSKAEDTGGVPATSTKEPDVK